MPRAIMFDLDGTLVGARETLWELFSEINETFALGVDSRDAFFRMLEGNFYEALTQMCSDPKRAEAARKNFMELLSTHYNPVLIPGMTDVVRSLAPHCTLAIISSNGIETIRRILVDAGISTCFGHVFAGDVEPKKSASIRRFLSEQRYAAHRRCSPEYSEDSTDTSSLEFNDVVLVTDTVGDVMEAKEVGIRAIGVTWGMHTQEKLLAAGAEKVALWPQELIAWLRPSRPSTITQDTPNCACSIQPSGACVAASAAPKPSATKSQRVPVADPALEAGRLRRNQVLMHRKSMSDTLVAAQTSTQTPPTLPDDELMQALKRIMVKGT
ncbi:MAG: phosphatase-like protein [Ramlibacter sp.]|jgi:phosphoglycolate phosphatase|nr:phosphatase-like protein [Ramlibacter sp.]